MYGRLSENGDDYRKFYAIVIFVCEKILKLFWQYTKSVLKYYILTL